MKAGGDEFLMNPEQISYELEAGGPYLLLPTGGVPLMPWRVTFLLRS
jgi:hypothetical protein